MIRTTAVPRPSASEPLLAGVAAHLALAGCSADRRRTPTPEPTRLRPARAPRATRATYVDGTYTAEGSYQTPESVETISVTVTLEDDVITAVDVTGDPQARESEEYQGKFIGGISDAVVGQDIDEISVSRVAGSSLTSGGFNQAIDDDQVARRRPDRR